MNPKARSGHRGMPFDIKAALSKPASALTFCGSFIEAYLSPASAGFDPQSW
jgi:hypothetical protein